MSLNPQWGIFVNKFLTRNKTDFFNYKPLNFKTMKRSTLLKSLMGVFAILISVNLMAQYPDSIKHTEDTYKYSNTADTIYQTTGYGLTLYAAPDPVYSPSYDGTGARGAGLSTQSQWRWVYGADFATGTEVKDWANENWVVLADTVLPAVGSSRTFWVAERFGAANCAGAAQSKTVSVVQVPSITVFEGQNTGSVWTQVTAGTEYRYCCENVRDEIGITISETGSSAAMQNYTYGITVSRTAYDGNLAPIVGQTDVDVTGTYGKTANLASMVNGLTQTFNMNTANLLMYTNSGNKYATKYVFQLTANSLYSQTSRVSQARAGVAVSGFAVPATTVTYWLYPTPTTGPIYHIANSYAF